MSCSWRLNPLAEVALRRWDDEAVLHHRSSNDTHRLAEPSGLLLEHLAAHGVCLTHELTCACDADADAIAPVLQALSDLGLISRC
jgi:PqqD family protein of HPr-rel-A system